VCAAAPAFGVGQQSWDYGTQTWHTNLDTFDKLVLEELQSNATLLAMMIFLASEDPARIPRTTSILPVDQRTGQPAPWPTCRDGARSSGR
jgi:carboxypeptidase Q